MGWVVNATPRLLYPRERPGTHCIGDWVGPRAGLDGCGKSLHHWGSIPDRPARSESLYRLIYPGPWETGEAQLNVSILNQPKHDVTSTELGTGIWMSHSRLGTRKESVFGTQLPSPDGV
jgi:hypothetical protein